jgi:tRNA dimethylallyltransferase
MDRPRVVCVVGPTGVGKSEVAIEICKRYSGEVISADSMQIYRGMVIGTAKLKMSEQEGVAHHLLDVIDPTDTFTVAMWKERAEGIIGQLQKQDLVPVVCGGTGLYVRSLTDDLTFSVKPQNSVVRDQWQSFYEHNGSMALHEELKKVDPKSAARIHPNDVKRVIRALEVAEVGDERLSQSYDWTPKQGRYQTLLLGLWMDRAALYERVNRRVDKMVQQGLFEEVEDLLRHGLTRHHAAMQAIGYKEVVAFMEGETTKDEAIAAVKQNTRRYVKRQLSWFRRDPRISWFERTVEGEFVPGEKMRFWQLIEEFLEGKRGLSHE